jgi:hypothetical protein
VSKRHAPAEAKTPTSDSKSVTKINKSPSKADLYLFGISNPEQVELYMLIEFNEFTLVIILC